MHLGGLSRNSKQQVLAKLFLSENPPQQEMATVLARYRRQPTHFRRGNAQRSASVAKSSGLPQRQHLRIKHVTYVDKCCNTSRVKSIESGSLAGVSTSTWYSRTN